MQQLTATGGIPGYTWSVSPALAPGLSLNPATGMISGQPLRAADLTALGPISIPVPEGASLGTSVIGALNSLAIVTVSDSNGYSKTSAIYLPVDSVPSKDLKTSDQQAALYILAAKYSAGSAAFWVIALQPWCAVNPICESAAITLGTDLGVQAAKLFKAAYDPFDPNYKTLVTLSSTADDSRTTLAALLAVFHNESQLAEAMAESVNRAQAAAQSNDTIMETNQLAVAKKFAMVLANEINTASLRGSSLTQGLSAAALDQNAVAVQDISAFQESVSKSGLPADIQASLNQASVSPDDQALLTVLTASTPSDVLQSGIASSLVAQLISGPDTAQSIAALNSFAADTNDDLRVDCTDLALVKSAFGTRIGQPGFDVRADVNGDGIVDIRDLAFVSQQLTAGTKCQ